MSEAWMDRAKKLMDRSGKKQKDLQKALGVTRGAVGHYLSGRREPSVEQFAAIARELDTSVEWLLNGSRDKGSPQAEQAGDAETVANMYKKLPPFMQTQVRLFVEMQCALFDSRWHQFPRKIDKKEALFYQRIQDGWRKMVETDKARLGDDGCATLTEKGARYK